MNIFEYETFPSDVKLYFKDAIDEYCLRINLTLNPIDKPVNNFVFIENEKIVVCLDNISAFPYPDITLSFFLKEDLSLHEINQNELDKYINISNESISVFHRFHQEKYMKNEEFKDSNYGLYRYGIKFCGDLVIKYYGSLLNGKIDKSEILKMIKTN